MMNTLSRGLQNKSSLEAKSLQAANIITGPNPAVLVTRAQLQLLMEQMAELPPTIDEICST